MANKRFADVSPSKGDKDGSKEGIKSSSKTKPQGNPSGASFKAPGSGNSPRLKEKGGKDLACPSFEAKKNRADEASGKLPKGI